tara:strand:+ start:353 stop:586 length:234 start_codon:yes stop_codon:yes gene_type:complete
MRPYIAATIIIDSLALVRSNDSLWGLATHLLYSAQDNEKIINTATIFRSDAKNFTPVAVNKVSENSCQAESPKTKIT